MATHRTPLGGPAILGHNPIRQYRHTVGRHCDALTLEYKSTDYPHGRLSSYCARLATHSIAGHAVCTQHATKIARRGWDEASVDDTRYARDLVARWRTHGIAS